MVYILLGDGFEEIEAIAPLDILRRADIEVATVSLTNDLLVNGGRGVIIRADITLDQIDFGSLEMLVLPGGGGGVDSIAKTPAAMALIGRTCEEGKLVAAICAAPSLLATFNILDGKRVVCYPSVSEKVEAAGGKLQPELPVTCDNNLITSKAAGTSIEFGLEIVATLRDRDTSDKIRQGIFYNT